MPPKVLINHSRSLSHVPLFGALPTKDHGPASERRAARLVVQIAILVRRSMEPPHRGAASPTRQPIPTLGVPTTTTVSESYSCP
jgi:hypothetical protein